MVLGCEVGWGSFSLLPFGCFLVNSTKKLTIRRDSSFWKLSLMLYESQYYKLEFSVYKTYISKFDSSMSEP